MTPLWISDGPKRGQDLLNSEVLSPFRAGVVSPHSKLTDNRRVRFLDSLPPLVRMALARISHQ